jgi:HSP20 family protein
MRRNEEYIPARRGLGSDISPWSSGGGQGSSFLGASPWQTMRRMQEDMDRIFSQFFGGQGGLGGASIQPGTQTGMQQWAPSVDISQTDKEWCIEVDLPGVKREDITTEIQDHHLFIRAEMRQEEQTPTGQQQSQQQGQPQGQRQFAHRERRYGLFQRVLPLPENADEENVRCQFQNGVLTIHLPKLAQMPSRGRRIPIGEGAQQVTAGAKGGEVSSAAQNAPQSSEQGASGSEGGSSGKSKNA